MVVLSSFTGFLLLCRHRSSSPRVEGLRKPCDDFEERLQLPDTPPELVRSERLFRRLPRLLLRALSRALFFSTSRALIVSRRSAAFLSNTAPTDPRGGFSFTSSATGAFLTAAAAFFFAGSSASSPASTSLSKPVVSFPPSRTWGSRRTTRARDPSLKIVDPILHGLQCRRFGIGTFHHHQRARHSPAVHVDQLTPV